MAVSEKICFPFVPAEEYDGSHAEALFCDASFERRGKSKECPGDVRACRYCHNADIYSCRPGAAAEYTQEISSEALNFSRGVLL